MAERLRLPYTVIHLYASVHVCMFVCVQVNGVGYNRHVQVYSGQRSTLAVIPLVLSTLVLDTGPPTGLALS